MNTFHAQNAWQSVRKHLLVSLIGCSDQLEVGRGWSAFWSCMYVSVSGYRSVRKCGVLTLCSSHWALLWLWLSALILEPAEILGFDLQWWGNWVSAAAQKPLLLLLHCLLLLLHVLLPSDPLSSPLCTCPLFSVSCCCFFLDSPFILLSVLLSLFPIVILFLLYSSLFSSSFLSSSFSPFLPHSFLLLLPPFLSSTASFSIFTPFPFLFSPLFSSSSSFSFLLPTFLFLQPLFLLHFSSFSFSSFSSSFSHLVFLPLYFVFFSLPPKSSASLSPTAPLPSSSSPFPLLFPFTHLSSISFPLSSLIPSLSSSCSSFPLSSSHIFSLSPFSSLPFVLLSSHLPINLPHLLLFFSHIHLPPSSLLSSLLLLLLLPTSLLVLLLLLPFFLCLLSLPTVTCLLIFSLFSSSLSLSSSLSPPLSLSL